MIIADIEEKIARIERETDDQVRLVLREALFRDTLQEIATGIKCIAACCCHEYAGEALKAP